ncbi:MAG: hypothetical protein ABI690_25855 [Chloroflexota bacterium]
MKYYALTMTVTHRIGDVEGFDTEAELNKFGVERSVFTDAEKHDREADGNLFGPPIVFAFIAENLTAVALNNFEQPYAIYARGEKYLCVKEGETS